VNGQIRAEWLRLRKRRSLQIIVFAVPVLVGVVFVLGYNSIYEQPPFDGAAYRQELIDSGYVLGLPPEEAEPLLDEAVVTFQQQWDQQEEGARLIRATYVFPYSLVHVLGSATFVLIAVVLLTATTIGDEFGWATIRTSLIASTRRRRFLAVRLGAIAVGGLLIYGLLLLIAIVVPLVVNVPASKLPATMPAFDVGTFLVLLGGELVATLAVMAFAALITLLVRNGGLTLVSLLIWVAVEAAILTALSRLPNFSDGQPPPDAWLLDAFPLRGITTLVNTLGKAATGLPSYPGDAVSRELGNAPVPIVSFAILSLILGAAAFRRFQRMDIVE
jgi:ABC-type transport system involved in multi-copper enzyme maturation permease subunit